MKKLILYGTALSTVLVVSPVWADSLYRCSDGTFTNKAERQCPVYEPNAIVHLQPKVNREQTSEVSEGDIKQPFASVTLFDEQSKKRSESR